MPFFSGNTSRNVPRFWKILFWITVPVFAVLLIFSSRYYGITWDEWETSNNGIRALKNILTFGKDLSLMQVNLAYLYTHFFCVIVSLVYGLMHHDLGRMLQEGLLTEHQINNYFNISHALNALFGAVTALYAGLLAKKLGGWRGFHDFVLLCVSPRFFGHAMNNSKDIPFAAAYIFSIYYLSFFFDALPKIDKRAVLLSGIGIGICLGTRLGGAILVVYLAAITAGIFIYLLIRKSAGIADFFRAAAAGALITILASAICLIFWPYARTHGLIDTVQAFMEMSDFTAWNYPVLFDGKMTMSVDLPWYYIPKWILISSPLFFIPGLTCFILFVRQINLPGRSLALMLTAAFFPLAFILLRDSNVYDSWRHLLFIYPPLIIFCALGIDALWNTASEKKLGLVMVFTLTAFCAEPAAWMIQNPRNAGVYFNPAAGGLKKSFANYESDYWGNCLRESSEWLAEYHKNNFAEFPFAWVLADGTVMQTYPYLKKELGERYQPFGYPSDFLRTNPYVLYVFDAELMRDLPWNYAVLMSRRRTPKELQTQWPPAGTIHTVEAEGVPICAVVRNENFYRNLAAARAPKPAV